MRKSKSSLNKLLRYLLSLPYAERMARLASLSADEQQELQWHWRLVGRDNQVAPPGDWRTWLILAGRGFGKTRAGAEWVREVAEADPHARIALIGASLGEVRAVMVEGESGIVAVCPPKRRPHYESSLRRVTWPNGAKALLYSAQEPESLRGPQHSHARRSGPEGRPRQRKFGPDRCPAAPCDRGRTGRSPSQPGRGSMLAGRTLRHRGLGRSFRRAGELCRGQLAVRCPARWHARARSRQRAGHALPRNLASGDKARCARRWNHDRQRGAHGPDRADYRTDNCGNSFRNLIPDNAGFATGD